MDGVLLIDKPTDWTSHDVCIFVRKRLHLKKVGHAGTLDPLATGLLVVLLGRATKLSGPLSAHAKEYEGTLELGIQTDTHDRQGKVIRSAPWETVSFEQVREKVKQFTGDIIQVPPMVSALKHQGMRLYELARKGLTVPREGRQVTVSEFKLGAQDGPLIRFSVCVSKGTYVRTLVNDLGEALGCFATLAELRRVRSGQFKLENAVTIEDMRAQPPEQIMSRVLKLGSLL